MRFKDGDLEYRKEQAERTKKLWEKGHYNFLITPLVERSCVNPNCKIVFKVKPHNSKKFCGISCAAKINNSRRPSRIKSRCLSCGGIPKRNIYKYCSFKCQSNYRHQKFISDWKKGIVSGSIGITTKTIATALRRYLLEKYNYKCSICFWDKKNPATGHVPLEVDHIDGNSENNTESNLRILCPNCHSLTPSFRNLNKGKGRAWRLTYITQNKPF